MLQLEPAPLPASAMGARMAARANRAARAKAGSLPRHASLLAKAAREFATTPVSILLASFLVNLLALALPFTLLQIYDRILPNAAVSTLVALLLCLLGVVIIDIALRVLRDTLTTHAAVEKAFQARVQAFATLLHADPARVMEKSGRFWFDRMTAVEDVATVRENADKTLFIDLPFAFLFLGMIGLIGGWLIAVPIVMTAIVSIVVVAMANRQRQLLEERREEDEKRYAKLANWLSGIHTIKLLAVETQICRRFETVLARGVAYSYHALLQNSRQPMLGQLFSNLMMVAMSTAGAIEVIGNNMSLGTLACCSLLATRVAQPVFRVVSVAAQLQSLALAEARAQTVLGLPVEPLAAGAGPVGGAIVLDDVFVPPQAGWGGFQSLSLAMAPGEIVGIAAPAGSGKTAVLSLIDGSLAPAGGRVLIDERDARGPEMRATRRAIQRIDGRVAIFRGTILQNVAMFRTGVHIAEAVAAIEAIGLDAQIDKLPDGYDTQIGDGAQTVLPHGFQQALMIARALAQRPAILLVAKIGALLDTSNFNRLERALRQMPQRPTTILTSQRGSIMSLAERVYEIRDGQLHLIGDIFASMPATVAVNRVGEPLPPHRPHVKRA